MKTLVSLLSHLRRSPRLFGVILLGFLLGLPVVVAQLGGSDDRDDDVTGGNTGGGGDTMSDDETVGTLPLVAEEPTLPYEQIQSMNLPGLHFSLTGSHDLLRHLVVDAYGDGWVSEQQLPSTDPDSDQVRWIFHGNVSVVFDEALGLYPEIQTEARYGTNAFGAPARFVTPQWRTGVFQLGNRGKQNLQLARMRDARLLDSGPVQLHTAFAAGRRHVISVEGQGGLMRISQTR